MTTLTSLPNELLYHIAQDLVRPADTPARSPGLAALARCSRRLCDIAAPTLYADDRLHRNSEAVEWAAARGRLDTLDAALRHGLDLSARHGEALRLAVAAGHRAAVDWLLDHGSPVDGVYNPDFGHRYPPLFHALDHGHQDIAVQLLARGALPYFKAGPPTTTTTTQQDPQQQQQRPDDFDTTALHHAAARGLVRVARHLVEDRGMPVDVLDKRGATPLASAIMFSGPAAVRALVRLGADPRRPCGGLSPIMRAEMVDKPDNALALLDAAMNPPAADESADTVACPVLLCVKALLPSLPSYSSAATTTASSSRHASEQQQQPPEQVLMLLQILLHSGKAQPNETPHPDHPTALGEIILHGAETEAKAEASLPIELSAAMHLLVKAGAADAPTSDWCRQLRNLPAHVSAVPMARTLLICGARLDTRHHHHSQSERDGETFLEVAAQLRLPHGADALRELGEVINYSAIRRDLLDEALAAAARARNAPACRLLLSRGASFARSSADDHKTPCATVALAEWANERVGKPLADDDDDTFALLLDHIPSAAHYDVLFHCILAGDARRAAAMLDHGSHLLDRGKLPVLAYLAEERGEEALRGRLMDAQVGTVGFGLAGLGLTDGAEEDSSPANVIAIGAAHKMPLVAPAVHVSELTDAVEALGGFGGHGCADH